MEALELKPQRIQVAMRVFLMAFVGQLVMTLWRYGLCEEFEIWLFLRARAIEALVVTALASLFPLRYRDIKLTETTLQAPMKKRGRRGLWKSTTVELSDVVLSRAFVDRICGTQLVTTDDQMMDISSFYYPVGAVAKLLNEIEHRQELIINRKQPVVVIPPRAATEIWPC